MGLALNDCCILKKFMKIEKIIQFCQNQFIMLHALSNFIIITNNNKDFVLFVTLDNNILCLFV